MRAGSSARERSVSTAAGRQETEQGPAQDWTHLFGMSLSMGLGRITWRYSKLSSESAGARRDRGAKEGAGEIAGVAASARLCQHLSLLSHKSSARPSPRWGMGTAASRRTATRALQDTPLRSPPGARDNLARMRERKGEDGVGREGGRRDGAATRLTSLRVDDSSVSRVQQRAHLSDSSSRVDALGLGMATVCDVCVCGWVDV
jgi:hypothetical protein